MISVIRRKRWAILFSFIFFAATSMFARSWIPFLSSSWATLLAGCILSLFIVPQFLGTSWLLWVLLYSVTVLFNWWSGDQLFNSASMASNEIAVFFLFSSVLYYLLYSRDRTCINAMFIMMFLMIGIAAVGSIIVNQFYPGIVREQSFLESHNEMDVLKDYYRMGLSNYLLPHGLPPLIPPLILLIRISKNNKLLRFGAIVFLIFTLILVYLSGSTAVLLISLIGLLSFFIKDNGRSSFRLFAIVTILMVPFVMFPELIIRIISVFSTETSQTYASHLEDLIDYTSNGVQGTQGNSASRVQLYFMSLMEFLKSPLWGTNNAISNHSVLLDRLGSLGIIGFVPLIGILYNYWKRVHQNMGSVEKSFFNVSTLLFVLMLLVKGIDDKEVYLVSFIAVPVVLLKCQDYLPKKQKFR